ncbi:hypothetical protein [Pseudoalteromonas luteoviolacea]|uniref:HEAT repeat domain-containing protein n=1 Tax=Pseudoalteromonas luteoviolacea S4060-1 TaxID=1365257 RepID=A0A167PDV0_9GAMM|nr:hypothetical protein [Pseudoalteromonas luteoviolacea]KZN70424.1 hypothetical protein N478_00540 [Pseudoalteromonas luteoviolacea S4060-1]
MQHKRYFLSKYVIAAAILVLLVIGGLVQLRFLSTQPLESPRLVEQSAIQIDVVNDSAGKSHAHNQVLVSSVESQNSQTMIKNDQSITTNEQLRDTLEKLKASISHNPEPLKHAIMGPSNQHIAVRMQLLNLLEQDPDLISELIDAFIDEPNSLLGRELSAVLSESGHEFAQEAALDMALDLSHDEQTRAAGLLLVAKMEEVTAETRDRVLAHIDSGSDLNSDLQQFALMALKPAPSSQEDYQRVQSTLSKVVQAEDHNIRRHGVYQMAQWATNNEDLQDVRNLALTDPDVNTRARAVMSLGDSPFKSQENRSVLWQVADDENEPPPIRLYALKSLSRYALNDSEINKLRIMNNDIRGTSR